jgi:hypothetical protein
MRPNRLRNESMAYIGSEYRWSGTVDIRCMELAQADCSRVKQGCK